ncbi:UNVERIFIED_CONTAM: hypothetical protein HDU68_001199 [Siphonaria sp. JEL0065]|nr:hypothetical protein HDU68_001199 [Siphonaria sp. JEL0065]
MTKSTKLDKLLPDFDDLQIDGLSEAVPQATDNGTSMQWTRGSPLILNEYSADDVAVALETEGVAERLRGLGLGELVMQIDTSGDYVQRVSLSAEKLLPGLYSRVTAHESGRGFHVIVLGPHGAGGFPVGADNFLVDLFVRRRRLAFEHLKCYQEIMKNLPPDESPLMHLSRKISRIAVSVAKDVMDRFSHEDEQPSSHPQLPTSPTKRVHSTTTGATGTHFQHEFTIDDGRTARTLYNFLSHHLPERMSVTIVEWLALQNPLLEFTPSRPKLPGQHHPGLGVARQVTIMLVHMCEEKQRDCLVSSPEYFHNAVIYRMNGWRFLNPAFEGYLLALMDDLKADIEEKGLPAVSWAFQNCHVMNSEGVVEVWQMQEQYLPVSSRMKAFADSHEYIRLVEKFKKRYMGKLFIDWENAKELEQYITAKKEKVEEKPTVVCEE